MVNLMAAEIQPKIKGTRMQPRFYFATCQVGAEKAVKAEIALEYPQLRSAFSRPGFVTFKETDSRGPALLPEHVIFTRLWGEVLGQTHAPAMRETATDFRAGLAGLYSLVPEDAVLQIFDRDQHTPGEEPTSFKRDGHIRLIVENHSGPDLEPRIGEPVYSLIWVDDTVIFLGRHIHRHRLSTAPGNVPDIVLPPHAPSRAYLKIEEAFQRFEPAPEKGMTALEIGCAPGGATTAMLDRGLTVVGIDPQHMDERVEARQGFRAIRKAARFVLADDLTGVNPDLLVMDMSITPFEAITELSHVLRLLRSSAGGNLKLRRAFMTLKLNSWKLADDIPEYLKRLGKAGFGDLHPMQLCSNRQEFFVYSGRFDT